MREPNNIIRIFDPFGGGYTPEDHGRGPPLEHTRGWGRWPLALIALLLGITTAGGAILAATRTHAPVPELWKQNPPAFFMKTSDGYGLRELLF